MDILLDRVSSLGFSQMIGLVLAYPRDKIEKYLMLVALCRQAPGWGLMLQKVYFQSRC